MAGRYPAIISDPTQAISNTTKLSEEARTELMRLAPQLAQLLAERMPTLSVKFLQMLEEALTATITLKVPASTRKNAKIIEKEIPHWELRKTAMQMMYGLHMQVFDRGGASAVRTNEVAGSLEVNQNVTERRLAEMSKEELEQEEAELVSLLARASSSPETAKPSGRTPVFTK
jgi:hypothetical protein